jgi:hypothetical protein
MLAAATGSHTLEPMKLANLEAAVNARPFRAFEIRVDGEAIAVHHPEQVLFAERKSTVIIDAGDKLHIMDVAQISKVALLRRRPAGIAAKGKPSP